MAEFSPLDPQPERMTDYQFILRTEEFCQSVLDSEAHIESKAACSIILAYAKKHLTETRTTRNESNLN